jgi:hypothetical protein
MYVLDHFRFVLFNFFACPSFLLLNARNLFTSFITVLLFCNVPILQNNHSNAAFSMDIYFYEIACVEYLMFFDFLHLRGGRGGGGRPPRDKIE